MAFISKGRFRKELGPRLPPEQAALRVRAWFSAPERRGLLLDLCAAATSYTRVELSRRSTSDLCDELARALRAGILHAQVQPRVGATRPEKIAEEVYDAPISVPRREEEVEVTWIEIELLDETDEPVPRARYRIDLPDGSTRRGRLDAEGWARVDNVDPGNCVVTFPDLDEEAWSFMQTREEKNKRAR